MPRIICTRGCCPPPFWPPRRGLARRGNGPWCDPDPQARRGSGPGPGPGDGPVARQPLGGVVGDAEAVAGPACSSSELPPIPESRQSPSPRCYMLAAAQRPLSMCLASSPRALKHIMLLAALDQTSDTFLQDSERRISSGLASQSKDERGL